MSRVLFRQAWNIRQAEDVARCITFINNGNKVRNQ